MYLKTEKNGKKFEWKRTHTQQTTNRRELGVGVPKFQRNTTILHMKEKLKKEAK